MKGHFTSHYLAEVLRDLFFEESTGYVRLVDGSGQQVGLHFDRGMLYFAEGGPPEDAFDALLGTAGLLPATTLFKLKAAAPAPLDMASRIVAGRILTKEAIGPVIRATVERAVLRAFSWPGGTYEFTPGDAVAGFFDPDVLLTFECILKGIGGMANFGPLREVLLRLPSKVRLGQRTFLPVDRLALGPNQGFILSRVDGSSRLDEIALLLPHDEEDAGLRFLYGLAVLGILVLEPPTGSGAFSLREIMMDHHESAAREDRDVTLIKETASTILAQTPMEILGVGEDADLARVRQAFENARKKFARSRFSERVREGLKKELGLIESKLAESFLKLQVERLERAGSAGRSDHPVSEIDTNSLMVRREMVKTEAQAAQEQNTRLAEKYFQKAREYFAEKDYHNCIQFCRLAIKFNTDSAAVYALMAEALAKNPNSRWQRMAEEAFQKACDLDPWNAEYRVALGTLYQSQGLGIRARKQFEKALEILPTHAGAKAAMKGRGRR